MKEDHGGGQHMMFFLSKEQGSQKESSIELSEFTKKNNLRPDAFNGTGYESINHIPIFLSPDPSLQDVANICNSIGSPVGMHKFTGALTNTVWRVELSRSSIILRIYGSDSQFIDRDVELYITLLKLESASYSYQN